MAGSDRSWHFGRDWRIINGQLIPHDIPAVLAMPEVRVGCERALMIRHSAKAARSTATDQERICQAPSVQCQAKRRSRAPSLSFSSCPSSRRCQSRPAPPNSLRRLEACGQKQARMSPAQSGEFTDGALCSRPLDLPEQPFDGNSRYARSLSVVAISLSTHCPFLCRALDLMSSLSRC